MDRKFHSDVWNYYEIDSEFEKYAKCLNFGEKIARGVS